MLRKLFFSTLLGLSFLNTRAQENAVHLIDPAGNISFYTSIFTAYNALPEIIEGNYVIEIQSNYDGTVAEVYPISLNYQSINAGFGITIRPAIDNIKAMIKKPEISAGVLILLDNAQHITIDGRPGGTDADSSHFLTIQDEFVDNVTGSNIKLINGSSYNLIQYIKLKAEIDDNFLGSRNIQIGDGLANSFNTIRGCIISGGFRSIQDNGSSASVYNANNIIEDNIITQFGSPAIFAGNYQTNIIIRNNKLLAGLGDIHNSGLNLIVEQSQIDGESFIESNFIDINSDAPLSFGMEAFTIGRKIGKVNISNNVIKNFNNIHAKVINGISIAAYTNIHVNNNTINNIIAPNGIVRGIVIGGIPGKTPAIKIVGNIIKGLITNGPFEASGITFYAYPNSNILLANNFIAITDQNTQASAIYGISLRTTGPTGISASLLYNSIYLSGGEIIDSISNQPKKVLSAGIFRNDSTNNSLFIQRNNIVINERARNSAGWQTCFYNTVSDATYDLDYNTYYTAGTQPVVRWEKINYFKNQLEEYKSAVAPLEQNVYFNNVTFASDTDLHLAGNSVTDGRLLCVPVDEIQNDIDGEDRSETNPYRGADEVSTVLPLILTSFNSEKVQGSMLLLKWVTSNETNVLRFVIEHSTNGYNYIAIGNVNPSNNQLVNKYEFLTTPLVEKNNYYRLKIVDDNGKTIYSQIIFQQSSNEKFVTIYPNPARNSTTLKFSEYHPSVVINLFDAHGKKIFSSYTSGQIYQMPLTHLTSGTYIIYIQVGEKKVYNQLLIVK